MKLVIHTLLLLICIVVLAGCEAKTDSSQRIQDTVSNVSGSNEPPSSEVPTTPPAGTFEIPGTITYKNIEGGFYAIDGDDGKKYDPINLPEAFRKDGLKVIVSARIKQDAMSFHMYGVIIEVVNIAAQ